MIAIVLVILSIAPTSPEAQDSQVITVSIIIMPYPSALKTNPKSIFFTDFDGTITLMDSEYHVYKYRALCANALLKGNDYMVYFFT